MSGFPGMGMHRVRWALSGGPEIQCARCMEFLPATLEFWKPEHGLRRCRACLGEAQRERVKLAMRKRRADPAIRAGEIACRRAKRAANLDSERDYQREWYRRNRSVLARHERGAA